MHLLLAGWEPLGVEVLVLEVREEEFNGTSLIGIGCGIEHWQIQSLHDSPSNCAGVVAGPVQQKN